MIYHINGVPKPGHESASVLISDHAYDCSELNVAIGLYMYDLFRTIAPDLIEKYFEMYFAQIITDDRTELVDYSDDQDAIRILTDSVNRIIENQDYYTSMMIENFDYEILDGLDKILAVL